MYSYRRCRLTKDAAAAACLPSLTGSLVVDVGFGPTAAHHLSASSAGITMKRYAHANEGRPRNSWRGHKYVHYNSSGNCPADTGMSRLIRTRPFGYEAASVLTQARAFDWEAMGDRLLDRRIPHCS